MRPGRGLRLFAFVLSALLISLTAATVLLVPLLVLQATGHGSVSVDGEITVPYSFPVEDGRVGVSADGSTAIEWDGAGDEPGYGGVRLSPTLPITVHLAEDDVDARATAALAVGLTIGAAWIGLISLRRVVRSALNGCPFDGQNVARLRWCAAAVLAAPSVAWVMGRILEATIDTDIAGARLTMSGPDWGVYALVGLGLLALAQVFRTGAALQELESSTV